MVDPTIITALSILRRVQGLLHVHIVCDQISGQSRARIQRILDAEKGENKVSYYEKDSSDLCAGLSGVGRLTPAMFLRLHFDTFFPGIEKMVYVDTDVLFMSSVSSSDILISPEFQVAAVTREDVGIEYRYKIPEFTADHAFNSGVMVLDLVKIRETGLFVQTKKWLLKVHGEGKEYDDQVGINVILNGKYAELPPVMNALGEKKPIIIHYTGGKGKPWSWTGPLFNSRHKNSSLHWLKFRQQTPLKIPQHKLAGLIVAQFCATPLRWISQYRRRKRLDQMRRDTVDCRRAGMLISGSGVNIPTDS